MSLLRRPATMVVAALLVACALAVALVVWWPGDEAPARERRYQATTACLLTDDKGLTGPAAQAAWSAMREISDRDLIKVQNLAISGPQTAANGLSYFNTLAMQQCGTIIAVGAAPVAAAGEGRSQFPAVTTHAVKATTAPEIRAEVVALLGE